MSCRADVSPQQHANFQKKKKTTVESEIWKATLDIASIKTIGTDLNHLGSDHSPLNDIFTVTMRPTLQGHITRLAVAYTPFREHLPMELFSEFARKCASARRFIMGYVQQRRAALTQGNDKQDGDEAAVMQAMIENQGLWNDSEVVEHVSSPRAIITFPPDSVNTR